MEPCRVPDPLQNKITHIEGAFLDIVIVLAPDAFKVSGILDEGAVATFFEVVEIKSPVIFRHTCRCFRPANLPRGYLR
jgi:hypothetical protein